MGRWNYSNRNTVEECRSVDINFLKNHGFLERSQYGLMSWTNSNGEENSIGIKSLVEKEPVSITFIYTLTKHSGEKENLEYTTQLVKTPCNYGEFRYWFKCGGIVNGVHCGRRVAKLYKSPIGKYFLCRHCYDLTYQDRQKKGGYYFEIGRLREKIEKIDEKLKKRLRWKKRFRLWNEREKLIELLRDMVIYLNQGERFNSWLMQRENIF